MSAPDDLPADGAKPRRLTSAAEGGQVRRLAAIVSADIVGYSRLMGKDEEGTFLRVRNLLRDTVNPAVLEHRGRIIKNMGDGFLAMFESPVEAVRCAIVIQQNLAMRKLMDPEDARIEYRVGVNLGDVILDQDDIFGDGVNVAARLQGMAEPGGVCISGGIYEQVKNKLVVGYQSLGDEKLKNITDPVHVYRVLPDPGAVAQARERRPSARSAWLVPTAVFVLLLAAGAVVWFAWPWTPPPARQPHVAKGPPPAITQAAPNQPAPPAAAPAQAVPNQTPPPAPPSQPAPPAQTTMTPDSPPAEAARPATPAAGESSRQEVARQEAAPTPQPRPEPAPIAAAPAPAKPATINLNEPFRDCSDCPEMKAVPAGSFEMGLSDVLYAKPLHRVTIAAPFAIGVREVTFDEWDACVAEGGCTYRPNDRGWGRGTRPVIDVSWNDAKAFLAWLSRKTGQKYRLPSEAEWEYAARGGTATAFHWGREAEAGHANCENCAVPAARRTLAAGSFQPNAFGLFDTAGNAAEWVEDCWNESYRDAPRDGSAWVRGDCEQRVLRGGSFASRADAVRPGARFRYDRDVRYYANGFRVVRALP
jgi:formylglycine-generating enzyme required for sulfatase activity/class 3 adenylate cyclase